MEKRDIEELFYQLYSNKIRVSEFENRIYQMDSESFETFYGKEFYFELIDINYRDKYAKNMVEKVIYNRIPFSNFETLKIRNLLNRILEVVDIAEVLEDIYHLYCSGYTFLRFLGLSFILNGLDNYVTNNETPSWKETIFGKKKKIIINILPALQGEAQRILHFMSNGEIKIVGEFEYEDSRSDKDKIEINDLENMFK